MVRRVRDADDFSAVSPSLFPREEGNGSDGMAVSGENGIFCLKGPRALAIGIQRC